MQSFFNGVFPAIPQVDQRRPQLCYRGVVYQAATPAPSLMDVIETNQMGCYRGSHFKINQFRAVERRSNSVQLRYRGVVYHQ
jgi:Domain of unknown function (DUF4278)